MLRFRVRANAIVGTIVLMGIGYGSDHASLGVREAKLLIENLPEFRAERDLGKCPVAEVSEVYDSKVLLYVGLECSSEGRYNLGSFEVGLTSGEVARLGSTEVLNPSILGPVRARLFSEREALGINESEGSCLLENVPRAVEAKEEGLCPVGHIAKRVGDLYLGHLLNRCPGSSSRALSRELTVNRFSLSVSDLQTGEVYDSNLLYDLRSTMFAARKPPVLTQTEARRIVESLSEFAEAKKRLGDCAEAEVLFDRVPADSVWFRIWTKCERSTDAGVIHVVVNLRTGTAYDPKSLREFDSTSVRNARDLVLSQAAKRRATAKQQLAGRCPSK